MTIIDAFNQAVFESREARRKAIELYRSILGHNEVADDVSQKIGRVLCDLSRMLGTSPDQVKADHAALAEYELASDERKRELAKLHPLAIGELA